MSCAYANKIIGQFGGLKGESIWINYNMLEKHSTLFTVVYLNRVSFAMHGNVIIELQNMNYVVATINCLTENYIYSVVKHCYC